MTGPDCDTTMQLDRDGFVARGYSVEYFCAQGHPARATAEEQHGIWYAKIERPWRGGTWRTVATPCMSRETLWAFFAEITANPTFRGDA